MMKRFVGINQLVVAEEAEHPYLITNGVSTCICLLLKGRFGGVGFIGMYHWDGFVDTGFDKKAPNAKNKAKKRLGDLIYSLSLSVRRDLKQHASDPTEIPFLDAFYVIGGQRASEWLSGTELEVRTLDDYAQTFCSDYFYTSVDTRFYYENFQTSGSQDMSVIFSFAGVQTICPGLGDDVDEYLVDDGDEDDHERVSSYRF